MLTRFICLANSKKYNERCIAGIVVRTKRNGTHEVVMVDNKPKWIRPVTHENHGQVPAELVGDVELLDIVEINIQQEVPAGYQSENVLFENESLEVVGRYSGTMQKMDLLADNEQNFIFGNKGKAVHKDDIGGVDNSLTLIAVHDPIVSRKGQQYRINFDFSGRPYDLPITDIKFIEFCRNLKRESDLETILEGDVFLAISLGVIYGDFHFKLVAGVIKV